MQHSKLLFAIAAAIAIIPTSSTVWAANTAPTISGTPSKTANVGTAYSFKPAAKDKDGNTLYFSIDQKPSWATFSTTNGGLTGTPTSKGTFGAIKISVSDGKARTYLPTFDIKVSAAVSGGSSSTAPKISGSPLTAVKAGSSYAFKPTASDPNGDKLTFSVKNKPSWASFSTSTGQLSGTPSASNVGTTSGIVISVTDGKATASLSSFSLSVTQIGTGAATVSWVPPTQNTDGSTLTNLAGYYVQYGTSSSNLNTQIKLANAGLTRYTVDGLSQGKYYFAVKAYTSSGKESALSTPASKTIN